MFNLDPNSATNTGGPLGASTALPDGYGLTYFFNWGDSTPPDQGAYNIPVIVPSADWKTAGPMLILWRSITISGHQTYNWIAYKNLVVTDLPGYLTGAVGNNSAAFQITDAAALVVQVTRTSTSSPASDIIRVYYGSPPNASLGPADSTATDNKRLGYDFGTIQWPVATAAWHCSTDYCNDWFTLVNWDAVNTNSLATATGDGNPEPTNAVITSTSFPDPYKNNSVALYVNASTNPQADFFDFSIFVPGTGGGADGGGGVSVSP